MLKKRLLTGILVASAVAAAMLYLPPVTLLIIILAMSVLGQLEFYNMINLAGIPVFRMFGIVAGSSIIAATFWTTGPDARHIANSYVFEHLVLAISFLTIFIRLFPQRENPNPFGTLACTLMGIIYVPYLLNFFTRLAFEFNGRQESSLDETGLMLILYVAFVTKMTDTGAFFIGSAVGKHKLFPRVSPNKTWEGFFGGITFAIATSLCFFFLTKGRFGVVSFGIVDTFVMAILIALAGVAGDMFESLLKRAAKVKDSSSSLPGLGGLLDVLDSLLFGAPLFYYYVRLFLA